MSLAPAGRPRCGSWSPTWSRSARQPPAGCRWGPTGSPPNWAARWIRPGNVATGGTLFGNPLSAAAAARAALTEVLVPGAYAHTTALGRELADGIGAAITSAGLPWMVIRFGPRSGHWYGPRPRTGAEAHALTDGELTRLARIWLANRSVWEALPGAGPTVPVPAARADVARYLEAYSELLAQLR